MGDVAVGLNPKLAERIKTSDLLLVVGARLGEWTTVNYTLFDMPRPKQKFVHVHAGAEELGRVYQGDLLINSGMPEFAARRARSSRSSPPGTNGRAARAPTSKRGSSRCRCRAK